MSENPLIKIDEIRDLIYTVRGVQVMLDRDLALCHIRKSTNLVAGFLILAPEF